MLNEDGGCFVHFEKAFSAVAVVAVAGGDLVAVTTSFLVVVPAALAVERQLLSGM